MKVLNNILPLVKKIAFMVVLGSLLLQTIVVTISSFSENETEFVVKVDWDEDNDEEEKNDTTDEKINQQVVNTHEVNYSYSLVTLCYQVENLFWNFSQEIFIPPPQYS